MQKKKGVTPMNKEQIKDHFSRIDSLISKYEKELDKKNVSQSPFSEIYKADILNRFKSELALDIRNNTISPISLVLKIAETKDDYWRGVLKDFFTEGRSTYYNATLKTLGEDIPSFIISDAKVNNGIFEKTPKEMEQRKNVFHYLSYLKTQKINLSLEESVPVAKVLDVLQDTIKMQMPLQEKIATLSHSAYGFLASYDMDELYEDSIRTHNTDLQHKLDIMRCAYIPSNDTIENGGLMKNGQIQIQLAEINNNGHLMANYFEIHDGMHSRFNTFDFQKQTIGIYSKDNSFAKEYSFSEINFSLDNYYRNPYLINNAPSIIQTAFIRDDYSNILHFKDEVLDANPKLRELAKEESKKEIGQKDKNTKHGFTYTHENNKNPLSTKRKDMEMER